MKMKEELDRALEGVRWRQEDKDAVMKQIRPASRSVPVKRLTVIAFAVVMLMGAAAYAVGASGLLDRFFPDGNVREETEELLEVLRVTETIDGAVFTVEEAIYDGNALSLLVTVRNDGEQELQVCFSEPKLEGLNPMGGWIDGPFDDYETVLPGETLTGNVYALYETDGLPDGAAYTVLTTCRVLGDDGEVRYAHMTFDILVREITATYALDTEFQLPGYTIRVTEANFAPGSSSVRFDLIPMDPADTLLSTDGPSGKLCRWYGILDEVGEDLRLTYGAVGESARSEDGTLSYVFRFTPLSRVPEYITIVPVTDAGYAMDEAITVRIGR